MTRLQGSDSLKDAESKEDTKVTCPDCGQPEHEYWWDCPGPPRLPWERKKKRTHSFIIK